jgi:hypothetical protein
VKRRWETKWDEFLTTEKMRKGRRSPETGVEVGFEGAEVEIEIELESSDIEGSSSSAL